MGKLGEAKLLGGIGSILMLLSISPSIGLVLGIVGGVLVLIAVKYIAEYYNDRTIFNNMILAILLLIIGIAVGSGILIGGFATLFISLIFSSTLPNPVFMTFFPISLLLLSLVIIWILVIIASLFLKRSYDRIAVLVNVNLFSTSALLYVIGASLTIILIGIILLFIAILLQTIAFFLITEENKTTIPE